MRITITSSDAIMQMSKLTEQFEIRRTKCHQEISYFTESALCPL